MHISKTALAVCMFLSFATTSCSTPRGYEYYLDKDETHRDVYNITASVHSDGTCSFSIGEDESYEGLRWYNPEHIKNADQYFQFGGRCTQHHQKTHTDSSKYIPKTTLDFNVYIAKNTDAAMLKSGISLDVLPTDTRIRYDSPVGVYFYIRDPQTVKKPNLIVCVIGLDSLKGKATLQSKPDGEITLSVSALGYAADQGCVT